MKSYTTLLFAAFLSVLLLTACKEEPEPDEYRQAMRDFVMALRDHADSTAPDFLLIPQNGSELLTMGDGYDTPPAAAYLAAIDGQGQEDLRYGYAADNRPTEQEDTAYLHAYLTAAEAFGVQVLVTDYCWNESYMADSYTENERGKFITFAAPSRGLDVIPEYPPIPYNVNGDDIITLAAARNFLYLLDPVLFTDRSNYITALDASSYDLFIIDAFYEEQLLTREEVIQLQSKPNGARRLVIAYMSIGEAEEYRYYWQEGWRAGNPAWIHRENPAWKGNYKVRYWEAAWQSIIFGNPDAYLDRILAAGFDGAYLDIIDAYEYFE